ncbi:hypothetical protein TCAL_03661 [Tigriopus californicus]|uniref:RNA helicase n=1 Tax=Tigriopus californicus TaxID=6832 RepID=A0A553NBB8_TIGCA|nr:ATP-dependent RNA helicase vasa-like [Tigriopus californicus]TRY62742.1 hypothetical protein TCAL_03661 [Tigriopus californicus]|eukprot:TCALIF_03661-PA protein Name:"Similar to vas ATP-dependent RNA helicase vasa, isoform A (Drosophila melanogaster)" AED:0.06 eAED:0.06 QI:0/1/0.8/1/1/1/5/291/571
MSDPWNTAAQDDPWGTGGGDSGPAEDANNNRPGGKGCFTCGEEGHRKSDCPQGGAGGGDRKGCFKCGGDHMAKDCEQPDKCRRCGEEGHRVAECSQEPQTRVVDNEDGTQREIYVPKERTEEQLFDTGISSGINFDKFDKIPVRSTGTDTPKPINDFSEANLRSLLLDNVTKSGYTRPTPVQKYSIPIILGKRDLMSCAQTGSGKTAAFLLPILHSILESGCESNMGACPQTPQAVIVAPTRELAIQIKDEARKFSQGSMLKCVVAYGGTSTGYQLGTLSRGCHVLIATPGRLNDFVEKGKVSFENVRFLVLDEADRMLDMGFMPAVEKIVTSGSMPPKGERQTLMFSATFPGEIQAAANDFLVNYVFLTVGIVGGASSDVEQTVYEVEKFGKRDKLIDILDDKSPTDRMLIFVETKRNADFLATFLSGKGHPTTSIHGDRLQREREEALQDFKTGNKPLLVATAVAARGLDIKGVARVLNYDLPKSVDEYVHRIGRTGRVGNLGKAYSFFDPSQDSDLAPGLVKILSESDQVVPEFLSNFAAGAGAGFAGNDGFGGKDIRANDTEDADEW